MCPKWLSSNLSTRKDLDWTRKDWRRRRKRKKRSNRCMSYSFANLLFSSYLHSFRWRSPPISRSIRQSSCPCLCQFVYDYSRVESIGLWCPFFIDSASFSQILYSFFYGHLDSLQQSKAVMSKPLHFMCKHVVFPDALHLWTFPFFVESLFWQLSPQYALYTA